MKTPQTPTVSSFSENPKDSANSSEKRNRRTPVPVRAGAGNNKLLLLDSGEPLAVSGNNTRLLQASPQPENTIKGKRERMKTATSKSGLAEIAEGRTVFPASGGLHPAMAGSLPCLLPDPSSWGDEEYAIAQARQFMAEIAKDDGVEPIPSLERLPAFALAVAKVAQKASAPRPIIFNGGEGDIGFMWVVKNRYFYLYAELETMEAEWAEYDSADRRTTKTLILKPGSEDWKTLAKHLRAARSE